MPKRCCGKFSSFLWNSDNLGEVRINFFSEIESCINEIQYQVTKRRHLKNKQRNQDFETLSLAKIRDSETPSYKKRDCKMHITAKKARLRDL